MHCTCTVLGVHIHSVYARGVHVLGEHIHSVYALGEQIHSVCARGVLVLGVHWACNECKTNVLALNE